MGGEFKSLHYRLTYILLPFFVIVIVKVIVFVIVIVNVRVIVIVKVMVIVKVTPQHEHRRAPAIHRGCRKHQAHVPARA